MTNTNCLEGMQCPACKSDGPFRILCDVLVLWDDDGRGRHIGGLTYIRGTRLTRCFGVRLHASCQFPKSHPSNTFLNIAFSQSALVLPDAISTKAPGPDGWSYRWLLL
jgi:hypothetical protein